MTAVSVGVLAGGRSLRMGQDKALLPVGGRPVIQRVLERVSLLSNDVILVTNTPDRYRFCPDCRLTGDIYPNKGSLGGIHSALTAAVYPHCLIVGCDMPFLNVVLLRHLLRLAPGCDVVVPRITDNLETMHAVYAKACLEPIERHLLTDDLRIRSFFDEVHVCIVEREELERFDPLLRSFLNMNTPSDWDRLRQMALDDELRSGRRES